MIEIFIVFLFVLSLSAIAPPDYILIFISILSTLISIILIKQKPDNFSIIWFLGLSIIYILGVIGQLNNPHFKVFTSFIYFSAQFGLIIGSSFSSKYFIYKKNLKLYIKKTNKKFKKYIFAKRFLYFLTFLIIITPIFAIILGVILSPLDIKFSLLSLSDILQGAIGYRLKSFDAVGFSYESEVLQIYPRLILSKSAITLSLLALNSINWVCFKKKYATFFNIILILIFSGFRSGAFGMLIQLASGILLENSFIKINQVKVIIGSLISSFFLIPFSLLFVEKNIANIIYDRMPSFRAALDYALNSNFFGATFGSYWKYTVENSTYLTNRFGSADYEVFMGSEHLAGELLGSIGIIGFLFFTFMNITRVLQNIQNYSLMRGFRSTSLMIILLQIGLISAGIGAAVNIIGITYYIIMGWSIKFIKNEASKT